MTDRPNGPTRQVGDLDPDLRALRVLDPAHRTRPGADGELAAQTLADRILSRPHATLPSGSPGRPGVRHPWRRWVLVGATAAAVTTALVVLPPWGTQQPAFATWTAQPETVGADALAEIAEQCSGGHAADTWNQHTVIAEARGRITFAVAETPQNLRHCLLVDGDFRVAGSVGLSRPGRVGEEAGPEETAPDDARALLLSVSGEGEDAHTTIVGRVGTDVVGVELHPHGSTDGSNAGTSLPASVTATVSNGYFGAWWPGATEGVDLTLGLTDGTQRTVVATFDDGT